MKIIIEKNKISLEGKRLRLSNISASWEANGVMSSIAGGLADETENAIDIVSKSEKATAVW